MVGLIQIKNKQRIATIAALWTFPNIHPCRSKERCIMLSTINRSPRCHQSRTKGLFLILLVLVFSLYHFYDYVIMLWPIQSKQRQNTDHILSTGRIITYLEFKNSQMSIPRETPKVVPKLLFRTAPFPLQKAPKEVRQVLNGTVKKSKEYLLLYFDDHDSELFIQDHYPMYYLRYQSLTVGSYRADILRLLILYHFGGIYNDIGHVYTRPVSQVFTANDEFVTVLDSNTRYKTGSAIHNGLIAAYPCHPIIKRMLDYAMENVRLESYGDNDLDITGPIAMGKAFNLFFNHSPTAIIANGSYTKNNYKLRLFSMSMVFPSFSSASPASSSQHLSTPIEGSSGSTGSTSHATRVCDPSTPHLYDEQGQDVLCLKFQKYHSIMFVQRGVVKYGFSWRRKIVYYCSLQSTIQRHNVWSYLICLFRHQYIQWLYQYQYHYEK